MDTSSPRHRAALAICLPAFVLAAGITGCVHADIRETRAIERTLQACRLLSPEGPEGTLAAREEEAWFWFQRERAQASRLLWNRGGIAALEARIARTPDGPDRDCLARTLREARTKRIESF
jgi:hypothetical protein